MAQNFACETIITEDDLNCDCKISDVWGGLDEETLEANVTALLESACDALVHVTGYPVGRCVTTYRPCRDRCHYFGCPCGCSLDGILLPGLDPEVTEVKIDGAVIPTSEYTTLRVGGFSYLERFNSEGLGVSWPSTQRLRAPSTADNTFEISVRAGTYPDQIAKNAAAEIACDMLAYLASEREVAPDGVISAQVYGVNMNWKQFGSPTEQETMRIAGMSWVQRFIATRGGSHPFVVSSPGLSHGWTLVERVAPAA